MATKRGRAYHIWLPLPRSAGAKGVTVYRAAGAVARRRRVRLSTGRTPAGSSGRLTYGVAAKARAIVRTFSPAVAFVHPGIALLE